MPTKRRPHAPASPASAGFAGQLRETIAGRGLTAYSVARSAGVAPSVVSRFLSRERSLNLETFDAIAGALGLRLVESGRGRGRPSRSAGTPPDPGQKFDKFDTHPGPDVFHCFTETGEFPSPGPVPDGTTAAATGDDATPVPIEVEATQVEREVSPMGDTEEAAGAPDGAKRPFGLAAGHPADALGHMVMDDDGAPPACQPAPSGDEDPAAGYWRFPTG